MNLKIKFSESDIKIPLKTQLSTSTSAVVASSTSTAQVAPSMTLPNLAKKMKKLASSQLFNLKLLLNGESSRGFSKFKKNYKLKGELGRGGFGIVYRAVRIRDDLPVAVKFIDRNSVKEWARVNGEQVPMEICMLAKCSKTRGVIRLIDWYSIPEGYLIIMERPYPCVDMFDFIKGQGKLNEDMARFLFRQIAQTVTECAHNRVLHRDLKDENVVIDLVNGSTRLIDFGAATSLRKTQYSDFQGTRLYCPPEWFLHSLYLGREAAVWSLGVLLYNSLNGRLPFRNEKDICTAHLLGPLPFYVPVSQDAKDLINKCLAFDPFQRCPLETILQHPWLSNISPSWEILTNQKNGTIDKKGEKENKKLEDDHGSEELEEVDNETNDKKAQKKQNNETVGSEESGVGSSEGSSIKNTTKKASANPVSRLSKTSLLVAPTSGEIKAAVQASKTTTQYNNIKPQRKTMMPRHPQPPSSTVLTALRRAMSREAQKRVDIVAARI
ncbi:unnamed protein product [Caenorhabditis angaria]|uniref:non-specific serine/threonine protein kinase n=1 Tax=Caenorhabditis angaria TaxID=860376 RepID=A0A9P1N387_9PELO|nr:unnamed protein product [Caenorhabditis angaria]